MISIIICSRFQSISKELKDNIENTVGVVHEIICIDNSKSQYDIFSAYNEGVKRSQYPLLCFMHEDILHYTNDWGKLLINHFRDLKVLDHVLLVKYRVFGGDPEVQMQERMQFASILLILIELIQPLLIILALNPLQMRMP